MNRVIPATRVRTPLKEEEMRLWRKAAELKERLDRLEGQEQVVQIQR
jgi:hypothetical protein